MDLELGGQRRSTAASEAGVETGNRELFDLVRGLNPDRSDDPGEYDGRPGWCDMIGPGTSCQPGR